MEQSSGLGNQQATMTLNMGWLVGFYEGEGSFCLQKQVTSGRNHKPSIVPRIEVSSTDYELIYRVKSVLRNLNVSPYIVEAKTKGKNQLKLQLNGIKRCKKFLDIIIPYMTESRRKHAAKIVQKYCNHRLKVWEDSGRTSPYGSIEFDYWSKLRELNGYQLHKSLRDSTRDVFNYNTKVESSVL